MIKREKSTDADELGNALREIARLAAANDAGELGTRLQDAMERTKDPLKFRSLRACVPELVDALNHARLLGLLKWPTCLDTCRQDLLVAFNKATGRIAKTSFWDAVAWARDNHLDVESPAKWVDDSESQAHR
jgi:hypothetical protein